MRPYWVGESNQLTQEPGKVHKGSYGVEVGLIDDGWMTVKLVMGSEGATWGGGRYDLTQELEMSIRGQRGS